MGSLYPFAQPQMSIVGPYASRVNNTSDNSMRVPGLIHVPKVSRRKVSPSHHAVLWQPVRHTYDQPASCTVCCRRVPSKTPPPRKNTPPPPRINPLNHTTSGVLGGFGKSPSCACLVPPPRRAGRPL